MTKQSNCFQDFARYTSLNVLGMIGLSCYILADTYFVAKGLGSNGLTALNLAIPIYSFIHGVGLMIGMGSGIKYSIQKMQDKSDAVNQTFVHAVILAAAFALCFFLLGFFCSDTIVRALGADENVYDMARTYLQVILLFSPAFLMNNVLICFVRNDGAPQLSMAAMLGGSLSNILLDWIFIFPLKMGILGAVFATGLAPVISMLILSVHFIKKRNGFHFKKCVPDGRLARNILSGGVPSLVTEVSSGIVMIVFNSIILSLQGNVGVAAYSIVANISLVVIAIYTGMAQGIQPIISYNHGVGNRKNIQSIFRYALVTMVIFSAAIYIFVFCFAPQIVNAFNSEGDMLLRQIAVDGLRLYFIACPFVGFNIILAVYFSSSEHAGPAHIISLLRGFVIIIPMAFILSGAAGLLGIWCTFPVTELLAACIGMMFYLKIRNVLRRGSYTSGRTRT